MPVPFNTPMLPMNALDMSTVDKEQRCSSTSASYQLGLSLRPSRLTPEQRRAIALAVRRAARDLQVTAHLLGAEGVQMAFSNSSNGVRGCDIMEGADDGGGE